MTGPNPYEQPHEPGYVPYSYSAPPSPGQQQRSAYVPRTSPLVRIGRLIAYGSLLIVVLTIVANSCSARNNDAAVGQPEPALPSAVSALH